MRNRPVMRLALAGWLAAAAAAAARGIPVYREYTLPISFADESTAEFAAAEVGAPDLAARRELRDAPSREALLGKETLLDLGLRAAPARGDAAPVPGKLSPPVAAERRRGSKDKDDRNWLAGSLTLPTLGQTASNAAAAVIAPGTKESSRGWLADEMAKGTALPETPQEQWRQELQGPDPYARDPASAAAAAGDGQPAAPGSAPISESAVKRNVQARTAPAAQDSGLSAASWPARTDLGGTGMPRDSAPAAGGMNQTRQLIAEYTGGARPDFAALRAALVQGQPISSGGDKSAATASFGAPPASGFGRATFSGTPASQGSSWQGGWRGAGVGSTLTPSAEPLPAPAVPATTPPRPAAASGGYKPAWY